MKGKTSESTSRSKGVGSRSSCVPPRSSRLPSTAFLSCFNHSNAPSADPNESMRNRKKSVSCSLSRTPPRRNPATRENAFQVFQRINAIPVRLFPASLQEWTAKGNSRRREAIQRKNVDSYSIDEEDSNGGLKAGEVLVVSGGGRGFEDEQHPSFRGGSRTLDKSEGGFQNVRQISSHDIQWVQKVAGYHVHEGGELFVIHTPATRPFSLNKVQKMSEKGCFSSSVAPVGVLPETRMNPFSSAFAEPLNSSHDESHGDEKFQQQKSFLSLLHTNSSVSVPSRRSFSSSESSIGTFQSRIRMRRLEKWSQWTSFCAEAFTGKDEELTVENRKESSSISALDSGAGEINDGEAGETNDDDKEEKRSLSFSSVYPFSASSKKRRKNFSDKSGVEARGNPQCKLHILDKDLPAMSSARTSTSKRMRVSLLIVSLHMGYLLEYERFTGKVISFVPPLLSLMSRLRNCALIILEQQAERIGIKGDEAGGISCAPNRMMMRMTRTINATLAPSEDTSPCELSLCRNNIRDKLTTRSNSSNQTKTGVEDKNSWVPEGAEINQDKPGSRSIPLLCASSSGPRELSSIFSLSSFSVAPTVFRIPSPSSFSVNVPISILSCFCSLLSTSSFEDFRVGKRRSQSELTDRYSHSCAPTIMNPLKDSLYTSNATSSNSSSMSESNLSSKHFSSSFFANRVWRDSRGSNSDRSSSSSSISALWFLHLESYFAPPLLPTERGKVGIPFIFDDTVDHQSDANEEFSSFRMCQPSGIKHTIDFPGELQETGSRKKGERGMYNDCSLFSSFMAKGITPLAVPITKGNLFKIVSKLDMHEADERCEPLYCYSRHSFSQCSQNAAQDVVDGPLGGHMKRKKNETEKEGKEENLDFDELTRKSDTRSGIYTFPFHPSSTDELYAVLVGVEPNILQ